MHKTVLAIFRAQMKQIIFNDEEEKTQMYFHSNYNWILLWKMSSSSFYVWNNPLGSQVTQTTYVLEFLL